MRPLPYSTYKFSGVQWLGDVPSHWGVRRVKSFSSRNDGGVWGSDFDDKGIIVLRSTEQTVSGLWNIVEPAKRRLSASEYSSARLEEGDLVVTKSSGSSLHIGKTTLVTTEIADLDCCFSNFMQRIRVKAEDMNPKFVWYFLNGQAGRTQFDSLSDTTTGLANLSGKLIGQVAVTCPVPAEQSAIIQFLDYAVKQIEHYIRAKEKLIALLEEQKQVMIHDAVTGRINVRTGKPYPAYKPSGVEYLGEIPEEWRALPLRRLTSHRCDGPFGSGLKSSHYTDEGIRVIRLQNIGHGEFNASDTAYISTDHYATLGDHSVEEGDVLIAGLGDSRHPAGRACVAPISIAPAMVKADCFRFRLKRSEVEPQFLAFQLTATAPLVSGLLSTGATRQRVNFQSASSRMVGSPPLRDQVRITDYVITRSWHINEAQHTAGKEISLLHEYRTRLIADVVTGKLDVREAAANLPELEAIADGRDGKSPAEPDSEQSSTTLHNEAPPATPGASS